MSKLSENHFQQLSKSIQEGGNTGSDGQSRCAICLKKSPQASCKICLRCTQLVCKTCFKIDNQKIPASQKNLYSSGKVGGCCFSDLSFQNVLLSDVNLNKTISWGNDSLLSQRWTSIPLDNGFGFDDNMSFEEAVEKVNTKYKEHPEIKLIEKDILVDDIANKKNFSRSFAEIFSIITSEVAPDKIKNDLITLLKSFVVFRREQKEIKDDVIYQRGHIIIGIFLLCFCSIKRAFFAMKDIYSLFFVDMLNPENIRKNQNIDSITKHIIFAYLENFQKKKEPTPTLIQKLGSFIRKYLISQYNFFFLIQLNFSSAFVIIEQLFEQRTFEVLTRGMAAVIHINLKVILESEIDNNLKQVIQNKVQQDTLSTLLLSSWEELPSEAKNKILEDYFQECASEQKKKYDCGAEALSIAVKNCLRKQNNNMKILEGHYQKQLMDLKRALFISMKELEIKVEKIKAMEIEKNSHIVKYQALQRKYEVNIIEYEDIQGKLEFLNERAGKRQMHYNKEYEEQVSNLQQQVKNQKLDFKELDQIHQKKQEVLQSELDEKNLTIKRLKEVIGFLKRNDGTQSEEIQKNLQSVLQEQKDQLKEESSPISKRTFMSYAPSNSSSGTANNQIRSRKNSLTSQSSNENDKFSFIKYSIPDQSDHISKSLNKQFSSDSAYKGNQNQLSDQQPIKNDDSNQNILTEESEIDIRQFYAHVGPNYNQKDSINGLTQLKQQFEMVEQQQYQNMYKTFNFQDPFQEKYSLNFIKSQNNSPSKQLQNQLSSSPPSPEKMKEDNNQLRNNGNVQINYQNSDNAHEAKKKAWKNMNTRATSDVAFNFSQQRNDLQKQFEEVSSKHK